MNLQERYRQPDKVQDYLRTYRQRRDETIAAWLQGTMMAEEAIGQLYREALTFNWIMGFTPDSEEAKELMEAVA